ncbi:MAG: hypothetical protein IJH34_14210 [Romboutsia sp.]|nr:hypothetical protein [Romboutsia sp.]
MTLNHEINCYQKTLEGLASYFSNLDFKVNITINSDGKFSRKAIDSHYNYEHFIDEFILNFKPKFTTFYNDKECLIKILIPKSYSKIAGKYTDSISYCTFDLLCLNEQFLYVKVNNEDLNKMSLDFDIAYSKVLNAIKKYCDEELNKLNFGLTTKNKEFIIKVKYYNLSLNILYS